MNFSQTLRYLFSDTRARVYLLWAILTGIGFSATHYYQIQKINGLWILLSVIGLGYMYRVMPMRVRQMRNIFLSWLIPIVLGVGISIGLFYIDSFARYTRDLGIIWLCIMAIGYFFNGLTDNKPCLWYWVAVGLHILLALSCIFFDSFRNVQYLLAAVVSVWSMTNLWLLRSFDS